MRLNRAFFVFGSFVVLSLLTLCVVDAKADDAKNSEKNTTKTEKKEKKGWVSLFDGKTLKGWKVPVYGGDGRVQVKKGEMLLEFGEMITGVTIAEPKKFPRMNYEVELEAKRVDGSDFFATTTFPVGKDCCSFVVGGWGGTVTGISCVDFYDAGDNVTTRFTDLKNGKWYKVRIRVSDTRIEAWIDDEKVVDLPTKDHRFEVRIEVDQSQPLGITSYQSTGAIRKVRYRKLTGEEVKEIAKMKES